MVVAVGERFVTTPLSVCVSDTASLTASGATSTTGKPAPCAASAAVRSSVVVPWASVGAGSPSVPFCGAWVSSFIGVTLDRPRARRNGFVDNTTTTGKSKGAVMRPCSGLALIQVDVACAFGLSVLGCIVFGGTRAVVPHAKVRAVLGILGKVARGYLDTQLATQCGEVAQLLAGLLLGVLGDAQRVAVLVGGIGCADDLHAEAVADFHLLDGVLRTTGAELDFTLRDRDVLFDNELNLTHGESPTQLWDGPNGCPVGVSTLNQRIISVSTLPAKFLVNLLPAI